MDQYTEDTGDGKIGKVEIKIKYPILDTRISCCCSFSVTLRRPPLDSEMGWTGELWSKTKFLILEN